MIDDSGLKCWGRNIGGQTTVPNLSNPTQVSAGYDHTCALDDSGVKCWGNNDYGQTNVPYLSNPSQISSGNNFNCAIDDSGITCWGGSAWGQLDVPDMILPYTKISAGAEYACSVFGEPGTVGCWGQGKQASWPPESRRCRGRW